MRPAHLAADAALFDAARIEVPAPSGDVAVQLFASAGVTVVGFLTEASANPAGSAYVLIAVVAVAVAAVASLLPGRTAAV